MCWLAIGAVGIPLLWLRVSVSMVGGETIPRSCPVTSGRQVSVETGSCHVHSPMKYPAHKG